MVLGVRTKLSHGPRSRFKREVQRQKLQNVSHNKVLRRRSNDLQTSESSDNLCSLIAYLYNGVGSSRLNTGLQHQCGNRFPEHKIYHCIA